MRPRVGAEHLPDIVPQVTRAIAAASVPMASLKTAEASASSYSPNTKTNGTSSNNARIESSQAI